MRNYSYQIIFSISTLICAIALFFANSRFKQRNCLVEKLRPHLSAGASIILPGDNKTRFDELTKRYVTLFQPDIAAVVTVETDADVCEVIKYAKKSGKAILAGSARHGWAATLSNARNAILINITPLSSIEVDLNTSTVTIGGGITTGKVMSTLQAVGKETPTGVYACIGFLGATLGGGRGRLQGLHGLMLDNLLSVDLVTAAGKIITVSETSYPDLFWGLRGAGHNFGIVTKAVFKIYDHTNEGSMFLADIAYDSKHIKAIFTALNKFKQEPETSIVVFISVQPSLKPIVIVNFSSFTPTESALSQLNSLLGHIPHLSRTESVVPWYNDSEELQQACASKGPIGIAAASVMHYDIPTILSVYSDFERFIIDNPSANSSLFMFESYPVQAVQAVDDAATAYALRQERSNVVLFTAALDPAVDEALKGFLKKSVNAFHVTGGHEKPMLYLNVAQGAAEFGALYGYDEWRRKRLTALKRKYDPDGMFNWYHPVPFN